MTSRAAVRRSRPARSTTTATTTTASSVEAGPPVAGPSAGAIIAAVVAAISVNMTGTVAYLAAGVLALVWLVSNPLRARFDRVFWILVAYLLWCLASLNWSIYENATASLLMRVSLVAIFLLSRDVTRTARDLVVVGEGYAIGILVSVARLMFGQSVAIQAGDMERFTLDGFNANYLGYAFAGGLAVNVLLLCYSSRKRPLWRAVSIAACLTGIVLTDTRGAMVSVVVLVVWLLLVKVLRTPPLRLLVWCTVVVAFAIFVGLASELFVVLDSGARATGDLSGRLTLWPLVRDLWLSSPLIGWGLLATVATPGLEIQAHNVFLETAASLGVVGLVLLVLQLVLILSPGRKRTLDRRGALCIGAFIAVSAPIYLSGVWDSALAAWILLAMFSVAAQLSARQPADATPPDQQTVRSP